MHINEYENIFRHEESHFFYVGNHKIILSLLDTFSKNLQKTNKKLEILDAGCGTGLLTKKLGEYGDVTGVDHSSEALRFAKIRNINVKKASLLNLPFKNDSFDVVTCVDVLTDISLANDSKALSEIKRVLKPTGIVILRVSANKRLRLIHDRHVHTRERYDYHELREILIKTGFIIEKLSFVNMILLPAAVLQQIFEGKFLSDYSKSAITSTPIFINAILARLLAFEAFLLRFVNLPFGIALIAVCRKI